MVQLGQTITQACQGTLVVAGQFQPFKAQESGLTGNTTSEGLRHFETIRAAQRPKTFPFGLEHRQRCRCVQL